MYKQTVEPELDPYLRQGDAVLTDWLGWCLLYVQTAFGAGWSGSSASEGWAMSQAKHEDRNLPSGVFVPIWFNHWGTYGGVYKNWGHVAILKDNTIWSSPLSHKPYADTFGSIGEVEQRFNCSYIGWTECIRDFRVIEQVADAPPVVAGNQRVVGVNGINYREQPNTSSGVIKQFESGDVLTLGGFVRGENYSGNDIWFVGAFTGGYLWSGAFTDSSTNGLQDLTPPPVVVPPVTPPVVPPVVVPPYQFNKDLDCVTEVIPAHTNNFKYDSFPPKPLKAVIHDFGTQDRDTYTSTVNWFKLPNSEVSAHFVISGKKITQMVALKDRAYHAGSSGNDFIGIETDPKQDKDTIASTRLVLEQLKSKYGYQLELVEHNQLMSTACGDDVDLKNYDITPPPVVEPPIVLPEPEKPPVEPPVASQTLLEFIKQLISKLTTWLSQWRKDK